MDETFRVVVEGIREWKVWGEYDAETGAWTRLAEPKVKRSPHRAVFGPYSKVGTARAQGSRESRGLLDAKVTVERATTTWEAIE
jgi:hypothetical protein